MARTKKTAKDESAAVKPAEKKAARKAACKTSVRLEVGDLSVDVSDIQSAVKKEVKAKGLEASELNIYVNTAEQAAYYTVNGEGSAESKVDLRAL